MTIEEAKAIAKKLAIEHRDQVALLKARIGNKSNTYVRSLDRIAQALALLSQ